MEKNNLIYNNPQTNRVNKTSDKTRAKLSFVSYFKFISKNNLFYVILGYIFSPKNICTCIV